MTENDEIRPMTSLSQSDEEFNASNVKEFTVAKIAQKAKVVAYTKTIKWTDDKTKEDMSKDLNYVYVSINDVVKPTRLNPQSKKAIQKGYKVDNWNKLVGKEIVATISSFSGNDFIIWKPQTQLDETK